MREMLGDLILQQGDLVEGGDDAVEPAGHGSGQIFLEHLVDFRDSLRGQIHQLDKAPATALQVNAHDWAAS